MANNTRLKSSDMHAVRPYCERNVCLYNRFSDVRHGSAAPAVCRGRKEREAAPVDPARRMSRRAGCRCGRADRRYDPAHACLVPQPPVPCATQMDSTARRWPCPLVDGPCDDFRRDRHHLRYAGVFRPDGGGAAGGEVRGRKAYRTHDAISSIGLGVMSQLAGVFLKLLTVGVYAWCVQHLALFTLPAERAVGMGQRRCCCTTFCITGCIAPGTR